MNSTEGIACAKVCYRRQKFKEHLLHDHNITDQVTIDEKSEANRVGRNCQVRFWCGFCVLSSWS